MGAPPPPVAGSPYPGWVWDAAQQRWVQAPVQAPVPPAGAWAGGPPPNGWPATPPPAGPSVGQHLKRAVDWNVSDIAVTSRERAALEAAGVHEPRMQALLTWRRSTMLVALPILLLGVVLSAVDAGSADDPSVAGVTLQRTALGELARWLPTLALALVPLAAVVGVRRWTELRRTSRVLIGCWALSILIPIATALLPIDTLIDFDPLRQLASENDLANGGMTATEQVHALVLSQRVAAAVSYALALLPVIITVPAGVIKGAGRMRFLFPAAALPGWFLLSTAPFYSIFLVVVFILIDQIIGNFLLVLGVGLLAFGPWLFVLRRKVYGRPMTIAEARVELPKAGRVGGWINLAALACIVLFLLTAKVEGTHVLGSSGDTDAGTAVFTYVQAARTAVEVFGRNLVTAVVFAMIFLSMVFAEWRATKALPPQTLAEHDMEMHALRRYAEG